MREDGGFEAAFDELFPRAVRLANRLLGDREVAHALGISRGRVKTHIHRGLKGLRGRLGGGLEEVTPRAFNGIPLA